MVKFLVGGVAFATFISIFSFLSVLLGINPKDSGIFGLALFYSSLFLAVSGILFFGFLYVRHFRKKREWHYIADALVDSFRQSVLISAFAVALIVLKQFNLLNIISAVFLVVFTLAIETYFYKMRR